MGGEEKIGEKPKGQHLRVVGVQLLQKTATEKNRGPCRARMDEAGTEIIIERRLMTNCTKSYVYLDKLVSK